MAHNAPVVGISLAIACPVVVQEFRNGARCAFIGPPVWKKCDGRHHCSFVMRRGFSLRLRATGRDANVAALFYSREQPLERYNMADTLKPSTPAI